MSYEDDELSKELRQTVRSKLMEITDQLEDLHGFEIGIIRLSLLTVATCIEQHDEGCGNLYRLGEAINKFAEGEIKFFEGTLNDIGTETTKPNL